MRQVVIWVYVIAGLLVPDLSWAGKVLGVRYWTAPDHTRIVLDVDTPPSYRTSNEGEPACLIIELKNTAYPKLERPIKINDSLVKEVKFKRKDKNTVGVVIYLKTSAECKVFDLKKYQGKPHRLVIDILNPKAKHLIKEEAAYIQAAKKKGHRIVVIDPGHGGEDPGAIGRKLKLREKNVVLSISKELYKLLKAHSGITPHMTRRGDYYVPLGRRVQIARKLKADLFVSIHANAHRDTSKHGSSIYYLSAKGASDKAARLLAQRENMADLIGGEVWAPDRTTNAILLDLSQKSTRNESAIFAKGVIKHYDQIRKVSMDHRLRSAPFAVLKSLGIPSVLLETAFISNRQEEKLLASVKFQANVASALKRAIVHYLFGQNQQFHVVKKGDTLWRIARQYGTNPAQLKKWNKLGNANHIFPGQKLRVGD